MALTEAVSNELKKKFEQGGGLDKFKVKKLLNGSIKFKDQKWIPLSKAFNDVISLPGLPQGNIIILRGHSDTGKTTAMLESAASVQKMGILPVFIITEMKFSWQYAKNCGVEFEEVKNAKGEVIDYKGFFLYKDRETLNSIEDVADFILDLLEEQKKGNLPYDLWIMWDSIGSIPCLKSINSKSNNNQWNANALAEAFGNYVNQQLLLSRKESYPYTNTLIVCNKIWVNNPSMPMEQPRVQNKGGNAMWYDAGLVITFGGISNQGTSKIKAMKDKKTVEFAKLTKIMVDKNHINGITTRGSIVVTDHGFIEHNPKAIEDYKKLYSKDWLSVLGSGGEISTVIEELPEEENIETIALEPNEE
jgi:hypothetical protein